MTATTTVVAPQYQGLLTSDDTSVAWALERLRGDPTEQVLAIAEIVDQLRDEIDELRTRRQAKQSRIDQLKDYLVQRMEKGNLVSIKDHRRTVRLAARPDDVDVADVRALPDHLTRSVRRPDKTALLQAFRSGAEVEGVQLLSNRKHIIIR